MSELERIREALAALEEQRPTLGDAVVDAAIGPMREKLATLTAMTTPEQRKLVTVLFSDMTGFTALTASHDSEDVREVMNAYFTRWTAAIEAHGGVIEKFIGDAVMAVFGIGRAQENDAERAVRAALAMRESLVELNAEVAARGWPSLAMRVGIATGQVVVSFFGERRGQDLVAVGDAVNLASRLQTHAPDDGILISHDTYRHVRGVFDVEARPPLAVKGIDQAVTTYLVLGAKPRAFRLEPYRVEDVETRMIGREAESDQVRDAIEMALEKGERAMITILGEAGLGKSRLLYETENWLELRPERILRFSGRATPGGAGHPYSLLRHALLDRLKIADSAPPGEVEEGLTAALSEADSWTLASSDPLDAGTRAGYVARLLGLDPVRPLDASDPREIHDRAIGYLLTYFEALAVHGPVGILLEDLHWSDDGSLDFVKRLARASRPGCVVIIATARPALLERRPLWSEGEEFHTRVDLLPLSRSAARRLLDEVLQKVAEIPAELRDLVVANAEGNPYYIEEIVRKLIDDDVILVEDGEWRVAPGRLAKFSVPETLLGLLQSRLDGLPPDERLTLERAGVIGRTFWDEAVAALDENGQEGRIPGTLDSLRRRELVFRSERSTFEGTVEHTFKHSLLRDVTYEGILKRTRRLYHARAAQWLIDTSARFDRQDEYAGLIAQHLALAEDPEAAGWYRRAADLAAAQFANVEAWAFAQHALELAGSDDATRFEILMSRREAAHLMGDRAALMADTADLTATAQRLGDPGHLTRAAMIEARSFVLSGEYANAQRAAEQAVAAARESADVGLLAESLVTIGEVLWRRGDLTGARRWADEGIQVAVEAGLIIVEANLVRLHGLMAEVEGRPGDALEHYTSALGKFEEAGQRRAVARVLNDMGTASSHLGEYDRAGGYLEHSLRLRRLMGDVSGEEVVRNNLGIVAVGRADLERAQAEYEAALALSTDLESPEGLASAHQGLGAIALRLGRLDECRRHTETARRGYAEIEDDQGAVQCLVDLAWCKLFGGDVKGAETTASQAVEMATAGGFLPEAASARLVWGRTLLDLGRDSEAAAAFQYAADDDAAEGGPAVRTMGAIGLARAVVATDPTRARTAVESAVGELERESVAPLPDPAWAYVAAYEVLSVLGHPDASKVLSHGKSLLGTIVGRLQARDVVDSYFAGVPANSRLRDLIEAADR